MLDCGGKHGRGGSDLADIECVCAIASFPGDFDLDFSVERPKMILG